MDLFEIYSTTQYIVKNSESEIEEILIDNKVVNRNNTSFSISNMPVNIVFQNYPGISSQNWTIY